MRLSVESWEKAVALFLVVACVAAAVLTQACVGEAEQRLSLRELQLQQVRALQAAGSHSHADPRHLDGLFADAALQWRQGSAATFLQLQPANGGPR